MTTRAVTLQCTVYIVHVYTVHVYLYLIIESLTVFKGSWKNCAKKIETFPPNIATVSTLKHCLFLPTLLPSNPKNQPTPEIQHSTRTSVLFDTAERTVRAVFDTDKNLTFYMDGFTQDSAVGAKLYLGYEGANLYKNVTVDFVGNSTGKHMVGLLVSF